MGPRDHRRPRRPLPRSRLRLDLSHGIDPNWLIIPDPDLARLAAEATTDIERHDTGINPDTDLDVDEDLTERMSYAWQAAAPGPREPDLDTVDHLARRLPLVELEERLALARQAARLATDQHGCDGAQLLARSDTAEHTAHHVAVGMLGAAGDRQQNVGTVTAVDDHSGTADVAFVASDGRERAAHVPLG